MRARRARSLGVLAGDGHTGVGLDVAEHQAVAAVMGRWPRNVGPVATPDHVGGSGPVRAASSTRRPTSGNRVIDINYRGTLNTVHAVLPGMQIQRQRGRIVSVAVRRGAWSGSSLESIYAGAKGAVISFSKSVAGGEVARYGITVNVVCPGPTDTPLIRTMADELGSGRRLDVLTKAIPMRRLATADDVAPVIVFLASDDAGFITGQTLSVSGGLTMAEPGTGMGFDAMVGPCGWAEAADLARRVEATGFSGMVFTETGQTPWMSIASAAAAAPTLMFSTGIAVAFPVSPMIAASIAWELAGEHRWTFPPRSRQSGQGAHRTSIRSAVRSARPSHA